MPSLYVHIPWCIRKCPYCDFNSHELHGESQEPIYTDTLLADLERELDDENEPIRTVFFGGGTPSLFHPNSFAKILAHTSVSNVVEVTMEANPGAVEHDRFEEYKNIGINRLSLGIQSFNPQFLKVLGRIHSASEARLALQLALKAGFASVNADLMFGLPGQSFSEALEDLQQLIAFEPNHISWYQLTIEPNTVFGKHPPQLPTDDQRADMSQAGIEILSQHGYVQYEVSAFARDGAKCLHNLNYWRFGDYIGIGAGAHGKFTKSGEVWRTKKKKQPNSYLQDSHAIKEKVDQSELPVEFMLNALRLREGVENEQFEASTNLPFALIEKKCQELAVQGLMRPDRIGLTDYGYQRLDDVVARFLS